jgi:hypothetical protein
MIQPEDSELLNTYYSLKNQYDTALEDKKKSILRSSAGKQNKRKQFLQLKPLCLNCKAPVGTIFKITANTEDVYRTFKIKCGNLADPCGLHIEFKVLGIALVSDLLTSYTQYLEDEKKKMVKLKNLLLFGIISNNHAIELFQKCSNDIKYYTLDIYNELNVYNQIVNNQDKKKELEDCIQLTYVKKQEIKECIRKMNEDLENEQSDKYATDVATISCNEMSPLLNQIRQLKYSNMFVREDDDEVFRLFQEKHSIQEFERNSIQEFEKNSIQTNLIELVEFKTGHSNKKKEESVADDDTNSSADLKIEYNNTLKRIPADLLELLQEDPQWLDDYIYSCIDARKNKKPCKLFLPRQTIVPPKVLEDGTYDFNSEVVNNLFNSLAHDPRIKDKGYQERLLTLYTEKNGVRDYTMLKDTLSQLLTHDLIHYNKGYFGGGFQIKIKNAVEEPIIDNDPSRDILWKSQEYTEAWSQLPRSLKDILRLNLTWLKDLMNRNVKAKLNDSNCNYMVTTPPNLQIPPRRVSDNAYDFQESIYNKVFNKLDPNTQQSYLAFYQENPTTKERSYQKLEHLLNSLVEQELKMNRLMI